MLVTYDIAFQGKLLTILHRIQHELNDIHVEGFQGVNVHDHFSETIVHSLRDLFAQESIDFDD
ncbi:MAG: hypothetical protein BWY82_02776 [Verrucomicrobia bacterium ADurb.Bin474]|nr:MAG: hypothetical protein BWY82_02776 [Verrucomicrobia bacterium ADurb.Bin474]